MKKLIIEQINREELQDLIQEAILGALNATKPEEEFLTIQEASAFTKIPLTTIYDYTSSQKIPFHKRVRNYFL